MKVNISFKIGKMGEMEENRGNEGTWGIQQEKRETKKCVMIASGANPPETKIPSQNLWTLMNIRQEHPYWGHKAQAAEQWSDALEKCKRQEEAPRNMHLALFMSYLF